MAPLPFSAFDKSTKVSNNNINNINNNNSNNSTAIITNHSSSSFSCCCCKSNTNFTFTLHLVRHAETLANQQGIVLGQSDSPLTEKGIQQAKATHEVFFGGSGVSGISGSDGVVSTAFFWKVFSSDLGRCVKTARLLLFGNKEQEDMEEKEDKKETMLIHPIHIILDKRLRERAKGIREGRSKLLTREQILKHLQSEQEQQQEQEEKNSGLMMGRRHNVPPPLEETEMQVMERFQDWLQETIQDAYKQHCDNDMTEGRGRGTVEAGRAGEGGGELQHNNQGSYHVLAVTHSGTLRIVLERLVGKQIPVDATREETKYGGYLHHVGGGDGCGCSSGGGRLVIPNTSRTVIQFTKSCCCKEKESSSSSSSSAAVMVVSTSVDNDDDDDDMGNGGITTRRSRKDQDGEDGYVTLSSSSLLSYSSTRWNATLLEYANVSHLYNHL